MGYLALFVVCLVISITGATKNTTRRIFLDDALATFFSTLEEYESQQNEVVFLLDESGSIGSERYEQVKLFTKLTVRNLLVSAQHSRVAIISFSGSTREMANYIKNSQGNNMCTLIKVINGLDYVGGGTRTSLAMEVASLIFVKARSNSNKIIILLTDGLSNWGYSPVIAANLLRQKGVIIFAVGVADVNVQEVEDVATSKNHTYILSNFSYIETVNNYLKESISDVSWDLVNDTSLCNDFCINRTDCCDSHASCNCGTQSGSYQCACNAGYYGTGHKNNCFMCPRGTYKPKVGNEPCTLCPHSTTFREGSTSLTDCSCEKGYQKHGESCKAVECAKLKAPPGGILIPANCSNLFGSECTLMCKEGYCPHSCSALLPPNRLSLQSKHCLETGKWSGEDFHCEEMRCPVLDHPSYGKHNCSGSDFVFGTVCKTACESGYELFGSNLRECLVNGTWTGDEAICTEVYCDPLKGNLNLLVNPSYCTKKNMKFNSVCQYYCARGYNLTSQYGVGVNDGINKCLANKTWSGVSYDIFCRDISPPSIRCPKSITTVTDPSKGTALVKWKEPNAVDNVFVSGIEIKEPSFLQNPHAFPIKTTKVVFEAYDSSGLTDTCSFTVTVIDKEAPKVLFCPKDIKIFHEKKTPIQIKWQEPKFTDNSGKWNFSVSNRKSGDLFSWGPPSRISYNVTDPSGNMAFCNFTIKVRQYPCPEFIVPENGIVTCDNWQDGHLCSAFCQDGYEFALSQKVPTIFRCGQKKIGQKKQMQWMPFKLEKSEVFKFPLPDCLRIQKKSALNSSVEMNFTVDTCNEQFLDKMRKKFIKYLKLEDKKYKGMICPESKGCRPENVNITCVSPPSKVKRSIQSAHERKAILMVSFNIQTYPSSNESLDESLTDNTSMAHSNPLIQDIEAQVLKDVREVYNMPTLPTPQVKYDVVLICSIGQIEINDSCVNCPTGTYKDDFSDNCIDCSSATYQDKESSQSCLPCPKDYRTFNTRSKSKDDCKAPCQPGTYSKTRFEPCDICPFNMYQEFSYGKECLKCPNGLKTWRVGSKSSSDCTSPCNPGSYSDTGLEPCSLCENGFYQHISQEKSCEPCPGNTSTDIKGAKDSTQCKEINLCEDIHPCSNLSTCIPIRNTYKCVCPYGLFGEHCEMYVDQCEPDTCSNNGTCLSSYGVYKCICSEGFSGKSCEINIDDCKQGHCQNNGKCIDLINDYLCECQSGFTGPKCEINTNDCALNPCQNGGICFDKIQFNAWDYAMTEEEVQSISSHCGVVGNIVPWVKAINHINGTVTISKDIDICKAIGSCFSDNCHCLYSSRQTDDLCKHSVQNCNPNPCRNAQQCAIKDAKFFCNCSTGYDGKFCELDKNECLLNNGNCTHLCINTVGSYECKCPEEMILSDDGFTCKDTSYCELGGQVYLEGQMWMLDCQTCSCKQGTVDCRKEECKAIECRRKEKLILFPGNCCPKCVLYSFCFISPTRTLTTFDHSLLKFSTEGSHSMVEDCVNGLYSVRYESSKTDTSESNLLIYDNCMKIQVSRTGTLLLDNSSVPASFTNEIFSIESNNETVDIFSKSGLFVQWHTNGAILIAEPAETVQHTCGLCGNYQVYNATANRGLGYTYGSLDGQSWMLDCQTKSCKQGTVDCRNEECKDIECRPEERLILFPGNCCQKCVLYSFCFLSPTRTLTTFDHSLIKFSTECTHTMVEDCVNGLYSVRYESSKTDTSESNLLIYDNCMKIQVSRTGTLLLDNTSVPASFKNEIFSIESNNETIDIFSKSGLFVQWHTNGAILIAVPAETVQHTSGICGNYQVYNATANGRLRYTDGSLVREVFKMISCSSLV